MLRLVVFAVSILSLASFSRACVLERKLIAGEPIDEIAFFTHSVVTAPEAARVFGKKAYEKIPIVALNQPKLESPTMRFDAERYPALSGRVLDTESFLGGIPRLFKVNSPRIHILGESLDVCLSRTAAELHIGFRESTQKEVTYVVHKPMIHPSDYGEGEKFLQRVFLTKDTFVRDFADPDLSKIVYLREMKDQPGKKVRIELVVYHRLTD